MARADREMAAQLAAAGVLAGGYHPRMEAVHRANAAALRAIIADHGWPGRSLAGEDGAEAAWLVVQHAIGEPDFMRDGLKLIADAVRRDEAPAWQAAMLDDRIRVSEGRPQLYGTQLEPDEDGRARPCPMEDPKGVEDRRRAVGLEPLTERLARAGRIPLPADPERHAREREDWLKRTGWRS